MGIRNLLDQIFFNFWNEYNTFRGLVMPSLTQIVLFLVEGGQRAIVFNRIGGMQMDTVLSEGLHFR